MISTAKLFLDSAEIGEVILVEVDGKSKSIQKKKTLRSKKHPMLVVYQKPGSATPESASAHKVEIRPVAKAEGEAKKEDGEKQKEKKKKEK